MISVEHLTKYYGDQLAVDDLSSEPGEEGIRTWYYEGREIDLSEVARALKNLSAERFADEAPEQKAEIGLAVYLENESFPEIALTLYRYDGADCLAQSDGRTIAHIPRSQVVELIETVNAIVLSPAD